MWMVDKNGVREAIDAIKVKLTDSNEAAQGLADLRGIIKTKEEHLWRASVQCSYAGVVELSSLLEMELNMLNGAADAVENGNSARATTLLDDFLAFIDENYSDEIPPAMS